MHTRNGHYSRSYLPWPSLKWQLRTSRKIENWRPWETVWTHLWQESHPLPPVAEVTHRVTEEAAISSPCRVTVTRLADIESRRICTNRSVKVILAWLTVSPCVGIGYPLWLIIHYNWMHNSRLKTVFLWGNSIIFGTSILMHLSSLPANLVIQSIWNGEPIPNGALPH